MLISIIITVLLLYVAFNTKLDGDRLPTWMFYAIALLTLASWQSAFVMLGIVGYCLYKGVKSGEVDTFDWLKNVING